MCQLWQFQKGPRKPDDPSRASGDRLQIPGARSSRDQSREVPEWLQSFEEAPLVNPPDSHNVVVEQSEVVPKEKIT